MYAKDCYNLKVITPYPGDNVPGVYGPPQELNPVDRGRTTDDYYIRIV